ncbi:winged helix-turn-helix domain-containing protein [Gemmatimonas groenlandica]|uniref:LysR family transcriptional regulator n=1 Tax=Gemmatimonas groenlandica TaxID=2732249 RepID=A0A6M4IK90_9BACT|nr:LysR family transcriptional regulator [Gemmatimonas groenlandica]QJR34279.1 LysR family transcriptional regulator [Gemmatimonas groenlandica]
MTTFFLRILFDDAERLGPGKVALLEAIAAEGSISGAARMMGMSYRRAWLLVETMNDMFTEPVTEAAHGGVHGGGASLTPFGHQIVERYRSIEETLRRAAVQDVAFLERHLRKRTG